MINLSRLGVRAAIVAFWVSLVVAFLFLPELKKRFSSGNAINIFAWVDMVDTEKIAEFEKETGISVNVNYYESPQELFAKLRVAAPGEYDMIMITEYALHNFPKHSFKDIDKSKLDFWHKIEPKFLDHPFDPENKFTIPFFWDVYGIGVNKKYLPKSSFAEDGHLRGGWDLIFDEQKALRPVVMINEALETMSTASLYLFGRANNLTTQQLYGVRDLLIKQKQWVESYTDLRADYYLISKAAPAVVAQSAYINRALKEGDSYGFIIPEEGSFLVIDSIVIPESSKREDQVYKFLNFLYKEDMMQAVLDEYAYLPVLKPILDKTDLRYLGKNILSEERFSKFHFFGNFARPTLLNKLWIEVKSA